MDRIHERNGIVHWSLLQHSMSEVEDVSWPTADLVENMFRTPPNFVPA